MDGVIEDPGSKHIDMRDTRDEMNLVQVNDSECIRVVCT